MNIIKLFVHAAIFSWTQKVSGWSKNIFTKTCIDSKRVACQITQYMYIVKEFWHSSFTSFTNCGSPDSRLTTRALLPSLPLLRQKLHQRVTSVASKLSPEIRLFQLVSTRESGYVLIRSALCQVSKVTPLVSLDNTCILLKDINITEAE